MAKKRPDNHGFTGRIRLALFERLEEFRCLPYESDLSSGRLIGSHHESWAGDGASPLGPTDAQNRVSVRERSLNRLLPQGLDRIVDLATEP